MESTYEPGSEPEVKKLWGALSALAGRPLTKDELGVLLYRACLLNMIPLFESNSLNAFLSAWEITAESYPIGNLLPSRRAAPQPTADFEEKLDAWRIAISYIERDLAADLPRISYQAIKSSFARLDDIPNDQIPSISFYHAIIRSALQSLTPQEFEELCYLLIQRDNRFTSVTHPGSKGSDQGIDILAYSGDSPARCWIFQSKRLAKYPPTVFTKEIDKLAANAVRCEKLVFLTSQELPAGTIRTAVDYGFKHGFAAVEFWGPVNLVAMIASKPQLMGGLLGENTPAIRELTARLMRLEQSASLGSPSQRFIEGLAKEVRSAIEEHARISPTFKLTAGAAAIVFLVREAAEVIESLTRPLARLARDKDLIERIKAETDARFAKYRNQLAEFDEKRLHGLDGLRQEFIQVVTEQQLGLASTVQSLIEMAESRANPGLAALNIVELQRDQDALAEIKWAGFLRVIKLDIINAFETHEARPAPCYLAGDRSQCPSCKIRLQFEKFGNVLFESTDGTYRTITVKALVCYKCGRVEFRGLEVRYLESISK